MAIQGLQLRGKTYYLRLRVPLDLQSVYPSSEIIRTLKTQDYTEACRRIHTARVKIESEFQDHRYRMQSAAGNPDMLSNYSDHDLEAMSLRWLTETNEKIRTATATDQAQWTEESREAYRHDLEEDRQRAKDEVNGDSKDEMHHGRTAARQFLTKNRITFDRKSEAYKKLSHFFSMAIYELSQRELNYFQGKSFQPTDQMFSQSHAAQPQANNAKKIKLRALCDEYMADQKRSQSTHMNYRIIFRALEEILGPDKYVHEISRDDCREVRAVLSRMPANSKKKAKNLTLREACVRAEKEGWPIVTTTTLNGYLGKLAALLEYATKEQYIQSNPAKGLRLANNVKAKDKRKPFDDEQLQRIFNAPVYTGCINDEWHSHEAGDQHPRRGRFWVPLISLWTGMRLNEICQLELEDICTEDGVTVILIRESEDRAGDDNLPEKRVKTVAGIRFVPVHPELQKIGFLSYIQKMRNNKEVRLFPELKTDSHGYASNNFSKWFARFLDRTGAKKPKTVFHSFRHSYRDAVREAELPLEATLQLGGWSRGTADEAYGKGLKASTLYKHICKVKYDGLDLSHLYQE